MVSFYQEIINNWENTATAFNSPDSRLVSCICLPRCVRSTSDAHGLTTIKPRRKRMQALLGNKSLKPLSYRRFFLFRNSIQMLSTNY